MSLSPRAAGLYPLLDPHWRRERRLGGLVLLTPLIGWPALLGYRRALVDHLFHPRERALPAWRGQYLAHLLRGGMAVAVILAYLAPTSLATLALATARGWRPDGAFAWTLVIVTVLPWLSTLALPAALIALGWGTKPYIDPGEAAALLCAFTASVALIPAGFLRISLTGRFRSALNLRRTLPFAWRRRRDYAWAWTCALAMNTAAFLALPLAPWGVWQGYVSSVVLFNELLLNEAEARAAGIVRDEGWLKRALTAYASGPLTHGTRIELLEADDGPVRVWRTPFFEAPLL